MESNTERESQERKIGPTVSKDKWLDHALGKLARGYVLIVGTQRKSANFHSKEKGYEMCAYNVARQLVNEGHVRKVRDHHLGDVYEIAQPPEPTTKIKKKRAQSADDDFETLLNELDGENHEESATAAPLS